MNELKPCPFCGGQAIVKNGLICCGSCGAEVLFLKVLEKDLSREEHDQAMIESWNSRHE